MAAPYFLSSDHGPVIRIKLNDWVNIIADASKPTTLSTSITVGTGQKTITVPTDRAFGPGQSIRIARTSDPSNVWMQGTVISYSGTSLVVLVASTSGSGTYSDWTITLVGGIGPSGDDGWTAQWRVASDGERRVWEIYDWFGGTGDKPPTGYVSASGVTSDISLAVDVRGPEGAKGDAGPANTLSIGTVQGGETADATITGTAPSQTLNLTLPKGEPGDNGSDGWTPVFAVVADGERRVYEIHDWTGGTGTKPDVGYLGPEGLVTDIAEAQDVRGSPGSGSVSTVNSKDPDSSGNVSLGISDIPGLEDALDGAGSVVSVNSVLPDAEGDIELTPSDIGAVASGDLAPVATSGSYNDLDDKPTIPQAPVNADWNASSGLAQILNKPVLGDLAAKNSVGVADIDATGTASSTTYLRGDGTWETPAGGGSGTPASIAEIRGLTGNNTVTPSVIASAYANAGILVGTGTINFDWRDLITDEVTLTGNRMLANPTNVIPGTERVIRVKGSNTTARLLSFGANFKGPLPQISVTNNREIVLFLYAVAADTIVVRAVNLSPYPVFTVTTSEGGLGFESYRYVRAGSDMAGVTGPIGSAIGVLLDGALVDLITYDGISTDVAMPGNHVGSIPSNILVNASVYSITNLAFSSPTTIFTIAGIQFQPYTTYELQFTE